MGLNNRLDITGVILVGGKSLRMGTDKAFIEFSGKPLFERVLEVHRESFQQIMFPARNWRHWAMTGNPF